MLTHFHQGATASRDRPPRDYHVSYSSSRSLSPLTDSEASRSSRDDHRDRDRDRDRERDRRHRSRSPGRRGGRREHESDTYSSSRDYREREREDRYRDRRSDHGWDRGGRPDRGDRDREHHRRDRAEPADAAAAAAPRRELFDERRARPERDDRDRGDRGGRPGRERERERERKRSASPPKRKREPTPDLTNTVPILERKRRLTQWDIKPPGYENVTSEQAKLSGMFPLPGAPRQPQMDPSKLQALANQPAGTATGAALNTANAKQSKRVLVYNLPDVADTEYLRSAFNGIMSNLNVVSGHNPCTNVFMSNDESYALLEFRAPEDATVAIAFSGVQGMSIQRPKDYIVPTSVNDEETAIGEMSQIVKDSPTKLSITNINPELEYIQLMELLQTFGTLKSLVLAQDVSNGQSRVGYYLDPDILPHVPAENPVHQTPPEMRLALIMFHQGFAFCEFADAHATNEIAVAALDGMEVAQEKLNVRLACTGAIQAETPGTTGVSSMGVSHMAMLAASSSADLEQGRVVQLLNMVTPEELMDPDEYQGKYWCI